MMGDFFNMLYQVSNQRSFMSIGICVGKNKCALGIKYGHKKRRNKNAPPLNTIISPIQTGTRNDLSFLFVRLPGDERKHL